ncbi:MAG: DNA-binding response regulator [Thalassobius sp.]|nr:DNA-binding response regulator [Thalassovita sp.]
MKIVIIEDEPLTAEDLINAILEVDASIQIVAQLESVLESVAYFQNNKMPDLIFSDIQLSDGLSLEVFKKVNISVPVIFCTAYDEYAIQAFKANGIDYIMKPFSRKSVADALSRFQMLKTNFSQNSLPYQDVMNALSRKESTTASVLVYQKDQIIPISIKDIALFYIDNELTHLITFKNESYIIENNLDRLDQITGSNFYRINRQYLVNREAIKSASRFFGRKLVVSLLIPYKETILVSKAKVTSFLNWLSGNV